MDFMLGIGGFILGYLFGSVPCGLWLVQALHGIDIRNYGSGNIGTTNVFRTVGPKTAAAVLLGETFPDCSVSPWRFAWPQLFAFFGLQRRQRRSDRTGPVPVYAPMGGDGRTGRMDRYCTDYTVCIAGFSNCCCGCGSNRMVSRLPGSLCGLRDTGLPVCHHPS